MTDSSSLHAPRMDAMYRNQRHIYDLTRRYYLLGRRTLIENIEPPAGGSVLEFGCGTASNLIHAARLYERADFYGFDISAEMLKTATVNAAKSGYETRIRLHTGDATAFDGRATFGRATYDRVFTSYTLSMIPDWHRAIDQMAACVAEHGRLQIVDFGDCANLPVAAKTILYAWLAKFHVTPRQDLHDVLKAASKRHSLTLDYRPLFRGYAQYAVLTRA
jgi:S-adenosylmethionine-diacylgycerolhomoserine-N-methlytransferase